MRASVGTGTGVRIKLDAIDLKILAALQRDSSLTNVELARRVHLSPSPCLARVKALEAAGVIRHYVALAEPKALGLGLNVFINISLKEQSKDSLAGFERRIAEHDEVMECYLMTGDADYLLRVVVPDVAAYERFLKEALTQIEGVVGIKSSFALRQVKYSTALPLPGREKSTAAATPQDVGRRLSGGDVAASRMPRKPSPRTLARR